MTGINMKAVSRNMPIIVFSSPPPWAVKMAKTVRCSFMLQVDESAIVGYAQHSPMKVLVAAANHLDGETIEADVEVWCDEHDDRKNQISFYAEGYVLRVRNGQVEHLTYTIPSGADVVSYRWEQ